jgi:hypothetical protein
MCPGGVKTRHEISFLKFDRAGCAVSHDRLSGKGRGIPDSATFRVFTQPVPVTDTDGLKASDDFRPIADTQNSILIFHFQREAIVVNLGNHYNFAVFPN